MDLVIRCGTLKESVSEIFRRGGVHHIVVAKMLETNTLKEAHACVGPTLPETFVREHEQMLCRDGAMLLTHRGLRYVGFAIEPSRDADHPDTFTFRHGWEALVLDHGIGENDYLIFQLSPSRKSHFDVYIFPAGQNPVANPAMAPAVYHWPRSTSGPQMVNLDALEGEPSGHRYSPPEREERQVVPHLEPNPRFSKRLTNTNLGHSGSTSVTFNSLEFPALFRKRCGSQLRTKVTLQGITPQSPEYVVCCSWHQELPNVRLFLRYGWVEFCQANELKVKDTLEFTMTSDSYFVVRKMDPDAPKAKSRATIRQICEEIVNGKMDQARRLVEEKRKILSDLEAALPQQTRILVKAEKVTEELKWAWDREVAVTNFLRRKGPGNVHIEQLAMEAEALALKQESQARCTQAFTEAWTTEKAMNQARTELPDWEDHLHKMETQFEKHLRDLQKKLKGRRDVPMDEAIKNARLGCVCSNENCQFAPAATTA